ncbi:MAG TPA: hypothetical protein VM802_01780 [Chitinophaga sp.]|uniref:hypothetical protein n=1 Tax=Chitinophaga sp. TaxID=1869181 RepID=UPI002BB9F9B8|nr:hypothetical protein [Chitinophaga sp.]HVI43562.1 hypothetical protein [Chitinophaga sp.]
MKEPKVFLKNDQHQQLISPKKSEALLPTLEEPGETAPCSSRDVCGKSNSSIGGSEDILF